MRASATVWKTVAWDSLSSTSRAAPARRIGGGPGGGAGRPEWPKDRMDSIRYQSANPLYHDLVRRAGPVLTAMAMMGAVRSIGQFPIFLGYVSAFAGLLWILKTMRVSLFLAPSYALIFWGAASLMFNKLGPYSYVQLAVALGGIGVAEMAARMKPSEIADLVSRWLVWIILAIVFIEFGLIEMGLGQRTRELSGELTGGLLPDLGVNVPRFMGSMGGSGFSGCMTGALGFLCLAEKRRRAAVILFLITVLMVSRGPLLAMVLAFLFLFFRQMRVTRLLAFTLVVFSAVFPMVIWYLMNTLSHVEILFLIQVSTQRFLHYMTFLNFGFENPLFGVGYGNYYEAYLDYFYSDSFREWGRRTNVGLIREAHNFMLDIFGEMGVVGWLLALVQMVAIGWLGLVRTSRYGAMLFYIIICFLFLSGLSNWTYWLTVGIIMSHVRQRASEKKAAEAPPPAAAEPAEPA